MLRNNCRFLLVVAGLMSLSAGWLWAGKQQPFVFGILLPGLAEQFS